MKIKTKLLLFLSLFTIVFGQKLEITSSKFVFDDFTIERYVDTSAKQGIQEILTQEFQDTTPNNYPFGYVYDVAVWHKLSLTNTTAQKLEYIFNNKRYYSFKQFEIYTVDSATGELLSTLRGGWDIAPSLQTDFDYSEGYYRNYIAPAQTHTIYLKTILSEGFVAEYELRVFDPYSNNTFITKERAILGIMVGILFALILYNLFIFVTTRDLIYLYYVGYLSTTTIVGFINMTGLYFTIFDHPLGTSIKYVLYIAPAMVFFITSFTIKLFETQRYFPKFHRIFIFFVYTMVFITLISLIFELTNYIRYFVIFIAPHGVILISFVVYATYKKHPLGLFYLVATSSFIVFANVLNYYYIGLLEYSFWTSYSVLIGAIIEGILLSLLLGYRLNLITTKNYNLEILSSTDELTGLDNRRSIMNKLDSLFKQKKRDFGVILIDIDYFKKVNDTYGHDIGDGVLIHIAKLIQSSNLTNVSCGRIGGEEFLFVMEHCTAQEIEGLGERVQQLLKTNPFVENTLTLHITVSGGITTPTQDDDMKSLIKRADEALYNAKEAGRNRMLVG